MIRNSYVAEGHVVMVYAYNRAVIDLKYAFEKYFALLSDQFHRLKTRIRL